MVSQFPILGFTQSVKGYSQISAIKLDLELDKVRLLPNNELLALSKKECSLYKWTEPTEFKSVFGGCGLGRYNLLEPSDFDPTEGLKIYLSDTGNQRILILDNKFQPIGTINTKESDQKRNITPGNISVNRFNEIYVLADNLNHVVKYDRFGKSDRGFRDIKVASVNPILMDVSGEHIVIASDSLIQMYSGFGDFIRFSKLDRNIIRDVQVHTITKEIFVLTDANILILNDKLRLKQNVEFKRIGESLISISVRNDRLAILTNKMLLLYKRL